MIWPAGGSRRLSLKRGKDKSTYEERTMSTTKLRALTAVLIAVSLMISVSVSFAGHPGGDVQLKAADGIPVTSTTPYSPAKSCGLTGTCHVESTPATGGHNYGSGEKDSTHVQGVLGSDNKVYWQAYQNKSFAHGVSVGRHMNQGRNEDYSNADRAAVGDPFFTSSLGMWGKY
jgi:hypothetical protein